MSRREEITKLYQQIGEMVDDYIDTHKIRPSRLGVYLKKGSDKFNNFLKRNKLNDIIESERVLEDIIDDRISMETDGVMKFEKFKFFESKEFKIENAKQCLYKGIDKSNLEMEKVLADVFNTNLGSIDVINSDKHLFNVDTNGKVIIYSSDDIDVIKTNLIDFMFLEISKREIEVISGITIKLGEIINEKSFKDEFKLEEKVVEIISKLIDMEYHSEFRGYFIFVD